MTRAAVDFDWASAGGFDEAAEAIIEAGQEREIHYLSDKHDIASYYQQNYPRNWQSQLSKDLAEVNGGKTTAASYARNFRPDRLNRKPTPDFANKLAKLGREKIPGKEVIVQKKVAGKRARVKAVIWMKISKDKRAWKKDIKETLTASQARKMREGNLDGLIEAYGGINPAEIVSADIESFSVEYV
jgi:hypothetical protein